MGRRSGSDGSLGSLYRVRRIGGSSRGGRLKSSPIPSSDGLSAASARLGAPISSRTDPIAICAPAGRSIAASNGSRLTSTLPASCPRGAAAGASRHEPSTITVIVMASVAAAGSSSRTAQVAAVPTVNSPGPSRWTTPAPGPPIMRTSIRPGGSGGRQPAGESMLIRAPSRIGESATVSISATAVPSTNRRGRGKGRTSPPGRMRRTSASTIKVTGVSGSASSRMSALTSWAGSATVSVRRM